MHLTTQLTHTRYAHGQRKTSSFRINLLATKGELPQQPGPLWLSWVWAVCKSGHATTTHAHWLCTSPFVVLFSSWDARIVRKTVSLKPEFVRSFVEIKSDIPGVVWKNRVFFLRVETTGWHYISHTCGSKNCHWGNNIRRFNRDHKYRLWTVILTGIKVD